MKRRKANYNPKRKIMPFATKDESSPISPAPADRDWVAVYKGNPQHKMYPNDYGLTPSTDPRPGKTLCDATEAFPKARACALLEQAFRKGMVSVRRHNGWPQNAWAVDSQGEVYEVQLENCGQGHYHGYPMPLDDDFRKIVIREWKRR